MTCNLWFTLPTQRMETISSLQGTSVDSGMDSSVAGHPPTISPSHSSSSVLSDSTTPLVASSESSVEESTNISQRVESVGNADPENLPPNADSSACSLSLVAVGSNLEIHLTTPPRSSCANTDDGMSDAPRDRLNLASVVSVGTAQASETSGIITTSPNGSLLQNSTSASMSGGLRVNATSPSLPRILPHTTASSSPDARELSSPGAGADVQISHQSLSKRRRGSNSDSIPAVKKEKPDDGYENMNSGNSRSARSVSARAGSSQLLSPATTERQPTTALAKKRQRVSRQNSGPVAGVTNANIRLTSRQRQMQMMGNSVHMFSPRAGLSLQSGGLQSTVRVSGRKNALIEIAPAAPRFAQPVGNVRGPGMSASSFVPPASSVPAPQSSFKRTLIRISTPQLFRNRSLHVHVTRKVKSLAGRSAIDRYIAAMEPPAELHVGVPRRYVCPACGDEFVTNTGMTDHLSRRTMVLAFRCLCSSATWPRNFYNPCTLVAFYQAHRRGPGVHAPCDAYTASVLADNTAEYVERLKERDRQLGADVLAAAEVAAAAVITDTAECSLRNNPTPGAGSSSKPNSSPKVNSSACTESRSTTDSNILPSVGAIRSNLGNPHNRTEKTRIDDVGVGAPLTTNGKVGHLEDSDAMNAEMEKFFDCLGRHGTECAECKVPHESRHALAAHFAHSRPNCTVLTCVTCETNLLNKCRFDAHQRLHELQRPCVCPECGVRFDDAVPFDVFRRHVELACFHVLRSAPRFDRCVRCNVELREPGETQMADHLVDAHATTYHKCSGCPMAFSNAEAALRHSSETNHDAQHRVVHKCPSCDAVFDGGNTAKMRSHVIGHFNSLTFHCPICDMRVNRRSRMAEHLRAAHASETACLNICEVCGLVCITKDELYEHVKSMHGGLLETVLKLKAVTPAPTGNKDGLETMDGNGTEGGMHLECLRCQMQFTSKELHRRHLAKHRFVEGKHTDKKRRSKEDLTNVSDNNADMVETICLHVCTKCRQEFKTAVELNDHWSTAHPAPAWHTCHLCADAFHNADDLKQHVAARHSGKAAARSSGSIVCLLCAEKSEPGTPPPRCFAHQGLLTKHLHSVHGIVREDATRRAREMVITSSSKYKTERDDETDADEKPATSTSAKRLFVTGETTRYQCALCEFGADARAEFVEHLVQKHQPTVTGAVQCNECGSCFAVVPALHRHLRIVHRIVCDIATYMTENGISVPPESEATLPYVPLPAIISNNVSVVSPTASDSSTSVSSGSTFTSVKSRSSVHSLSAEGTSDGSQECTVCYRKFGSVSLLRCHMRVHGMAFIQGTRRRLSGVPTDAK